VIWGIVRAAIGSFEDSVEDQMGNVTIETVEDIIAVVSVVLVGD
jgi:hypothetical protein